MQIKQKLKSAPLHNTTGRIYSGDLNLGLKDGILLDKTPYPY
jgi:hypothetical protein